MRICTPFLCCLENLRSILVLLNEQDMLHGSTLIKTE